MLFRYLVCPESRRTLPVAERYRAGLAGCPEERPGAGQFVLEAAASDVIARSANRVTSAIGAVVGPHATGLAFPIDRTAKPTPNTPADQDRGLVNAGLTTLPPDALGPAMAFPRQAGDSDHETG